MTTRNEVAVVRNDMPGHLTETESAIVYTRPTADVYETEDSFVVKIEMPGVSRENTQVRLEHETLSVKGLIENKGGSEMNVILSEMQGSGYERSFRVGDGIDRERIEARSEQGVLTMKLYKKEEVRPREITIR